MEKYNYVCWEMVLCCIYEGESIENFKYFLSLNSLNTKRTQ